MGRASRRLFVPLALLLATDLAGAQDAPVVAVDLPPVVAELLAPLRERVADDSAARLELAMALHASGFHDAARPLYDAHLAASPDDARAWFFAARLADARGDVQAASAALDRARELAPADAELAVWRFVWRLDAGLEVPDEAFGALRDLGPMQLSLLTAFGRIQLHYENPDPVLGTFVGLVRQYGALEYVGWTYRRLLAIDDVVDQDALQLPRGPRRIEWDPWSLELGAAAVVPDALARWADAATAFGLHELVLERVGALLEHYPRDTTLSGVLQRSLASTGDLAAALDEARRFASLVPSDLDGRIRLLTLLYRTDAEAEGLALFEELVAERADDPRVRLYRAQHDLLEGRLDAAEPVLRSLVEQDPTNTEAAETLSRLFGLRGNHAEAARWLERVVRRRPWRVQSWMRCAQDHARGGSPAKARELLEVAAKLGADPALLESVTKFVDDLEASGAAADER